MLAHSSKHVSQTQTVLSANFTDLKNVFFLVTYKSNTSSDSPSKVRGFICDSMLLERTLKDMSQEQGFNLLKN